MPRGEYWRVGSAIASREAIVKNAQLAVKIPAAANGGVHLCEYQVWYEHD